MPDNKLSKSKNEKLLLQMEALNIQEKDILEKFIKGSGKGGQKVNKTSSTVYIKHIPTGIELKCSQTRSQTLNRYYARKELCRALEYKHNKAASKKQKEIEKIRRQKKKRSKRAKEKILENKNKRSKLKNSRKSVKEDES